MQLSMFDGSKPLKITKPVRLIELFGGIGAQAKALENLNIQFEHYRMCDFDKYAVASYNAVHGTDFVPTDITQINAADLGITDTDKYEYIMTYSFPCTDLSNAGKQAGMSKGSGTRSGLLWEVERLLNECTELPQILLMENVPQVISEKNIKDFSEWTAFLDSKGYASKYNVLNAKDYGIPQNRERCYMLSWLNKDSFYLFPEPIPLKKTLKDLLDDEVDEKWYLTNTQIEAKLNSNFKVRQSSITNENDIARTLCARDYKEPQCVKIDDCNMFGMLTGEKWDKFHESSRRIYDTNGLCPTITAVCGGGHEKKIVVSQGINNKRLKQTLENHSDELQENSFIDSYNQSINNTGISGTITTRVSASNDTHVIKNYRVRKITPKECWRLMGFDDEDFDRAAQHNSSSQLYKQAGNSIVVNVLMAIFKELF